MIEEILNHWLVQFSIIAVILGVPTVLILRRYIEDKYTLFITKAKHTDEKTNELSTLTGKLGFLLKNPSLAFEQLHKQVKECDQMIAEFGDNEQMRKVWENKKKTLKWQLDASTKIMQNQQWIDFIGVDTIVPMIGGVETKLRSYVKGFTKNFGV